MGRPPFVMKSRQLVLHAGATIGVALLGIALRSTPGWWSWLLPGACYVAFWVLAVGLLAVRHSARLIGVSVFVVVCALEFLQRIEPAWMDRLNDTMVGAWLVGGTYDPWDFIGYALGALAGAVMLRWLRSRASSKG